MEILRNVHIDNRAIEYNINHIINQVFKILPLREENEDWELQLDNIFIEVQGLTSVLHNHYDLFPLICKLQGLKDLKEEVDFYKFRKTIFECIGHLSKIKELL